MNVEDLLSSFDLNEIESYLFKHFGGRGVSFGELVVQLLSGKMELDFKIIKDTVRQAFLYGISDAKNLFLSLLILGILSVMLNHASELLAGAQTVSLVKYFILLLVTLNLFQGFFIAEEICLETLQSATDFMRVLLPALSLSLGLTNGTFSAYAYYQFVFLLLFILSNVMTLFFIPFAKGYTFLAFMNGVTEEKRFQGILRLMEKGMTTALKVLTYVIAGSGVLRSILSVSTDHVNKTMIQKTISAIPGVGDITDSATEVFVSCALLIKNSLGIAALLIMLFICIVPLTKLLVIYLALRLCCASLEILGEKRTTTYMEQVSKGYLFLFRIAGFGLIFMVVAITMLLTMFRGG